jgi:hypothetical protein
LSDELKYNKNCFFCNGLGSDDSGDDYGSNPFPVCNIYPWKDNLKSFPFKKEQKCHIPNFWAVLEVDKEMIELYDKDDKENPVKEWECTKLFEKRYKINDNR